MLDVVKIALSQVGITEIKGKQLDNPEVMKYYHETGRTWVNHDETPWCDAFFDWCCMKARLPFTPGLLARDNLDTGMPVKLEEANELVQEIPIYVIFWRISIDSIYGHIGFFCRHNDASIWTLGGNQGVGQVNITPYPINGAKMGLLGLRRFSI